MNAAVEQGLIAKIKALPPQQVVEVVDFVECLAAKTAKRAAIDRLCWPSHRRSKLPVCSR